MKKLLVLSTAFALFSFTSLDNSVADSQADYACFEIADSAADAIGDMFGLSHGQEHGVFLAIYDACLAYS